MILNITSHKWWWWNAFISPWAGELSFTQQWGGHFPCFHYEFLKKSTPSFLALSYLATRFLTQLYHIYLKRCAFATPSLVCYFSHPSLPLQVTIWRGLTLLLVWPFSKQLIQFCLFKVLSSSGYPWFSQPLLLESLQSSCNSLSLPHTFPTLTATHNQ